MTVDQLPMEQQENAVYCQSCGEIRTEDELSECRLCGIHICGLDGCSSKCACDDVAAGQGRPRNYVLEALTLDCNRLIRELQMAV